MLRKLAYALGVCIGAVTLGYAAAGGDRFSTELVEVDIGAGYLIPRNYIVNIAPDAEDPELVTMRALWPGLEPLTEENTYLWERRIRAADPYRNPRAPAGRLPSPARRDRSRRAPGDT